MQREISIDLIYGSFWRLHETRKATPLLPENEVFLLNISYVNEKN